jgi:superfamily II DNA/RNA helicase
MKPEQASKRLHGITHAKARMYEFNLPEEHHIDLSGNNFSDLFPLAIGILGDEGALVANAAIHDSGLELRLHPSDTSALRFVASFFHAYVNAKQAKESSGFLLLLSASAYYLSDLAGSASVVLREADLLQYPSDNWVATLRWILDANWIAPLSLSEDRFSAILRTVQETVTSYFLSGSRRTEVFETGASLRALAYRIGADRELLIADIIVAVVKKRLCNAARHVLPLYSGLSEDVWAKTFERSNFMKELWPAQHVFGERGLLQGRSGVIQMPTSAGKTRAIELVIRSTFFSERADLAVVIAPFRALCTEITNFLRASFSGEAVNLNELSDALQVDYSEMFAELLIGGVPAFSAGPSLVRQIIVLTPEKLLYVLRHNPELINVLGLVIYDEGHQFDSGPRGVTYELLLTAIKRLLAPTTQSVLISAVIQNATAIGKWLIGDDVVIVDSQNLSTTSRSVAFASWKTSLGQLRFVTPGDPDAFSYFVPRVIRRRPLQKRGKETKDRFFPEVGDHHAIALYLGLQLVPNGSVAIFCGRKVTVSTMTAKLVEAFDRNLAMAAPSVQTDPAELARLVKLYTRHFGAKEEITMCAGLGVFSHHGNTPHGIRLAVEYAMKEGLAKFVLCTSTLAQGVNLPIRYLIVSGTSQGMERIRNKDFHNLVGRAGRAGMHTEGTIIFSDPALYDEQNDFKKRHKWEGANNLLNFNNAEATESSLLRVLTRFYSDYKKYELTADVVDLLNDALKDKKIVQDRLKLAAQTYKAMKFDVDSLHAQLRDKLLLLEALESYLMSHRGTDSFPDFLIATEQLAKETLAYFLATDEQKTQLVRLFVLVAHHVENRAADVALQAVYGRTLLGLDAAIRIREWVILKQLLFADQTEEGLLDLLWPLIVELLSETVFDKYSPPSALADLAKGWLAGKSFAELFTDWNAAGGAKKHGETTRKLRIEDIVDLAENTLGYQSTLIIAAVSEFLSEIPNIDSEETLQRLNTLQKRIKYGIADSETIAIYELGFGDREVAKDLQAILLTDPALNVRGRMRASRDAAVAVLSSYPLYFKQCLDTVFPAQV